MKQKIQSKGKILLDNIDLVEEYRRRERKKFSSF